jgi:hypothetical protein
MNGKSRGNWHVPAAASLAAVAVLLFTAVALEADTALLVYFFIIPPILLAVTGSLAWSTYKRRRPFAEVMWTLLALWVISVSLIAFDLGHLSVLHESAKWLVGSRRYKAEVLAQPPAAGGALRHIEWDGWGMFAQDTSVYLVFDPNDILSSAAASHQPGKFRGLPCEVPVVRRLEKGWYSITFYTDEDWDHCNSAGQ